MILVDGNLLIYAFADQFAEHVAAKAWIEETLSSGVEVGMPWPSLLAMIRITTNPKLMTPPVSVDRVWRVVESWLSEPNVWTPYPTATHDAVIRPFILNLVRQPNDVTDAHLAALAIEHDLTLASADRGFARFPGLRWFNPLA